MMRTLGQGGVQNPIPSSDSVNPSLLSRVFSIATRLGPAILRILGGGAHLEANQITPVQNRFHQEVLAPTVTAKDNPNTDTDTLLYWLDTLKAEGDAFDHFTRQFGVAGRQARETIFGIQDAAGGWSTTPAAPGYATQIMRDLLSKLSRRTGNARYQQLGIDWGAPAAVGIDGQVTPSLPPSQRADPSTVPGWVLPVGVVVALIFLARRK